jgi:arsenite-transporting ATPase
VLLNLLRDVISTRRIVFVGGKGGVGKTTVAAALAVAAADAGRRTLVVSTDPAHSLGDVFGVAIDAERRLTDCLWGLEIDPESEADAHITHVKQQMKQLVHPRMYDEVERQLEFARLAPGTVEAALLERIADIMALAGATWDLVVFDTAPTGHTLRLLALPEIMAAWTDGLLRHQARSSRLSAMVNRFADGGRGDDLSLIDTPNESGPAARIREVLIARQRKLRGARERLLDAGLTAFLLVLNADRLSILESAKALQSLGRAHVPVAAVVVNRVLAAEDGSAFLEARRRQEALYLQEIARAFGHLPQRLVPLSPEDVHGLAALRRLGTLLTA